MPNDRFGLYIHIPFCVRKCPYCDFNTFPLERGAVRKFLSAVKSELQLLAREFSPPLLDTVFIGGGTPTVLSGAQLSELMECVAQSVGLAEGAEVTVEANPGSVTVNGLRAMVGSGVTRVSMGVQSFSDEMLQRIGRNHTVRDVYASYEAIRSAGIENVNFDLMYALPGQSVADWEHTLSQALSLQPEHFSCYSLIIEEGTPFAILHRRGELDVPEEDDEARMYELTVEAMAHAGYDHYEISNFARPGYRCRHNLLYWRNQQWLAAGPGAHACWKGVRFWNVPALDAYIEAIEGGRLPVEGSELRNLDDQMDETVMLALRLTEGLSLAEWTSRFGRDLSEVYGDTVARLTEWGMLETRAGRLRLTSRGRMIGNRVIAEFLRSV